MPGMLLPNEPIRMVPEDAGFSGLSPWRPLHHSRLNAVTAAIFLVALAGGTMAQGAGGKVRLVRKYRSGQSMVYVTKVHTNSKIESNPPELKNFFPPMPTELRMNQQSTVTVSNVQADGAADVQHRFEKFEIQSSVEGLPENIRDSITQAQREVSEQMVGQTLTAHYDHNGRLVDFAGADKLFKDIDAPVRDPLLQMLRLFLEQMGGQSLYPDHPVKEGDEWSQDLNAQPLKDYPFKVSGKSTLHYSGKTRYQGVKAAIVDYHFENALTPAMEGLRKEGALPQLEAMGAGLEVKITGKGQGRILVALDDGRVLQNHSTLHQTLSAVMKAKGGFPVPLELLPRLEIQSDTEMNVEGNKP
jgi:hypothetical protein